MESSLVCVRVCVYERVTDRQTDRQTQCGCLRARVRLIKDAITAYAIFHHNRFPPKDVHTSKTERETQTRALCRHSVCVSIIESESRTHSPTRQTGEKVGRLADAKALSRQNRNEGTPDLPHHTPPTHHTSLST